MVFVGFDAEIYGFGLVSFRRCMVFVGFVEEIMFLIDFYVGMYGSGLFR